MRFCWPSKKIVVIVLGVAVAFACIHGVLLDGWQTTSGRGEGRASAKKGGKSGHAHNAADAVQKAMNGVTLRSRKLDRPPIDIFANLTGRDRKLAEAVQSALDAGDLSKTLSAVATALESTNSEVRVNAVEALSWFGAAALPELTGAMADPDEEVANAAENAWEGALSEIDDAQQRFKIAAAAMGAIINRDHLTTIAGQLSAAALEMIDGEADETKADEVRLDVMQTLVDIMEAGKEQNIEAVKEAYEEITGFEWLGIEEAERYLVDPEAYEPPSDNESAVSDGSEMENDT